VAPRAEVVAAGAHVAARAARRVVEQAQGGPASPYRVSAPPNGCSLSPSAGTTTLSEKISGCTPPTDRESRVTRTDAYDVSAPGAVVRTPARTIACAITFVNRVW
jgi:hypothetical protein